MKSSKSRQIQGPTRRKIFISLGLILLVLTAFFGGFFTQVALRGESEAIVSDIVHIMDQVGFVYDREKDEYVKIDGDKIATLIAGNFLDGYSEYYTEQEYKALQKQKAGDYSGFGINILTENAKSTKDGTNVIDSVTCNSPAFLADLKEGDKVISVNNGEEKAINNGKELIEFLNSTKIGDEVKFTVERNGSALDPITVKKSNYSRCYVTYQDSECYAYFAPKYGERADNVNEAYAMIRKNENIGGNLEFDVDTDGDGNGNDIAMIKLYAFNGDAAEQFGAAIQYMVEERGRTRLLLDLCDNGGGSMTVLQDVAAYLMKVDNGLVAKSTEKLDWSPEDKEENKQYATTDYAIGKSKFNYKITRISIIANRNTASASECLITAVHNTQYAKLGDVYSKRNLVIVGSENNYDKDDIPDDEIQYRTYGKGIMQTTYELNAGGALKITTAKLLDPWSNCIHKVGVIAHDNPRNQAQDYNQAVSKAVFILAEEIA